jgi:hypothetical protein
VAVDEALHSPLPAGFPHRAAAAVRADSLRSSGVNFRTVAFPPLRPSATAAGFFLFAIEADGTTIRTIRLSRYRILIARRSRSRKDRKQESKYHSARTKRDFTASSSARRTVSPPNCHCVSQQVADKTIKTHKTSALGLLLGFGRQHPPGVSRSSRRTTSASIPRTAGCSLPASTICSTAGSSASRTTGI